MKKYLTLGNLILNYRNFVALSQSDLASQMDVDIRSVIRWEKNETLLSNEKEQLLSEVTFIPYQVIRNLNSKTPIATFYDFDLRKYSLTSISKELPDAEWIKSRLKYTTDRIQHITNNNDFDAVIRFTELQRNPLKTTNKQLLKTASSILPELNIVLNDQSGNYSGHCIYFPLSLSTYSLLRERTIEEDQLKPKDLIDYKKSEYPVFYCHSITADCNENFFYIIGKVLNFFKTLDSDKYLYALLTSRYDSHLMSDQLGVKTVWEDYDTMEAQNLLDVPRLVEGNFQHFIKKVNPN